MPGIYALKEIKQGIRAVQITINKTKELKKIADKLKGNKKIYCIGCGSSYWAACLTAEFLREGEVDTQAVVSSEIFFSHYPESASSLVIAFSQSGETTATIEALKQAKENGAKTFSIINKANSSLDKFSDFSFITPAGHEHVLATKSFDSALAASYIFSKTLINKNAKGIEIVPEIYKKILKMDISKAIAMLKNYKRAYILGIGIDYGSAGETAIKLDEAALIQSTPLPALEISHGPKANIKNIPVILIAMQNQYEKIYNNLLKELKEAGAKTIIYSPIGRSYLSDINYNLPGTDDIIVFPGIKLSQRIAVETALAKGLNPDNPPTLKKFVARKNLK